MPLSTSVRQVHTLLKGLEKIAVSADIPMLVAGDFNSTPGSAAHALLVKRSVPSSHPVRSETPLSHEETGHHVRSRNRETVAQCRLPLRQYRANC